jgi:hypothetical protein
MNDSMSLYEQIRRLKRNTAFAMIPYIVSDMPLSVYSKALYIHIVRRCGAEENGKCFESAEHMAKRLKISKGSVINAKRELKEVGLIMITKEPGTHGEFPHDVITCVNIEWENAFFYSTNDVINSSNREELLSQNGKNLLLVLRNYLSNLVKDEEIARRMQGCENKESD